MRKYIVNLTDNLISKNRFDVFAKRRQESWDTVLKYIKTTLENNDVHEMNPETLGKVMCNLEIGDVMASGKDLMSALHFCGDCNEMLRELVALCLAYAIRDRLDPSPHTQVPPYGDVAQSRELAKSELEVPWDKMSDGVEAFEKMPDSFSQFHRNDRTSKR